MVSKAFLKCTLLTKTNHTNIKHDSFGSQMSTGDHFEELRGRLIYAFVGLVVCTAINLCFGSQIISFIEKPYADVMGPSAPLQTLAPSNDIIAYIEISLVAALIISSPWVFYHLCMFAAAGLYSNEKKYVYSAALFQPLYS